MKMKMWDGEDEEMDGENEDDIRAIGMVTSKLVVSDVAACHLLATTPTPLAASRRLMSTRGTMVHTEELNAAKNATLAQDLMAELHVLLEQEKANTMPNKAHMEQKDQWRATKERCMMADIITGKVTDLLKMQCDENRSRLGVCFHKLATFSDPSP
ncbi:hypothetical protein Tco_0972972 [Tanacetum coccineum]